MKLREPSPSPIRVTAMDNRKNRTLVHFHPPRKSIPTGKGALGTSKKLSLPAGESAHRHLPVHPRMLTYPNGHGEPVLENGSYTVSRVGGLRTKIQSGTAIAF